MRIVRNLATAVCVLFAVACGGSTTSPSADHGADASSDASPRGDASSEGGSCHGFTQHRPQAVACASNANDGGAIDAGPSGCGQNIVPHDACLVDADCGATGVCVCQAPGGFGCGAAIVTGNACVPANCRVDSDCGACGNCRAQTGCGMTTGFYCATPNDECGSDDDCRAQGQVGTACLFSNGRWSCAPGFGCAG